MESGPYAAKLNARFKAAGSSASMHARRRRSAASRSRTRSDAFLRSSRAASLDEVEVGDAGEAEAATKGAPIGPTVLCRPRHDVGGDGCEPPPVEIGTNRQPPADTTGIERLQRSDIGERKREPVAVRIPQRDRRAEARERSPPSPPRERRQGRYPSFRAPFPAASPRGRRHPSPPIARDLRSRGGEAGARTRRAVVHAGHRDRGSRIRCSMACRSARAVSYVTQLSLRAAARLARPRAQRPGRTRLRGGRAGAV